MKIRGLLGLVVTVMILFFAVDPASAKKKKSKIAGHDQFLTTEGFLSHHPDLRWRLAGLDAMEQNRPELAVTYFKRAAQYADKPSQAMLAEMYKDGLGVEADVVQAYIWMELAAERGWTWVVAKREKYWSELTVEQQSRVRQIGPSMCDKYADVIAKPRLEKKLRRGRRQVTGSRVGFLGSVQIQIPTANGMLTVSGDQYYKDTYWQPEKYWEWQAEAWAEPKSGTVTVHRPEVLTSDEAQDAKEEKE